MTTRFARSFVLPCLLALTLGAPTTVADGFDPTATVWSPVGEDIGFRDAWTTPDPAVQYYRTEANIDGVVLQRSDDGGRAWSTLANLPLAPFLLLVDRRDADVFFFGSGRYLLRSADGGRSYRAALEIGEVPIALAQDPSQPDRFYAAAGHRLWRSDDGGQSFVLVGQPPVELPGQRRLVIAANGDLHLDNPPTCFIDGCIEGYGYSISRDGGVSWQLPQLPFETTYPVLVYPHPALGNVLYATTIRPDGLARLLLRSEDRGANWHVLRASLAEEYWATAAAPDSLWYYSERKLHRSDDRGGSFTAISPPFPAAVPASYAWQVTYGPGQKVQLRAQVEGVRHRLVTSDGGATWIAENDRPAPPSFSTWIQGSRPGRYFGLDGDVLWRSDDDAETFQPVASFAPFHDYRIYADPIDAEKLYRVVDQPFAVEVSTDGGHTFVPQDVAELGAGFSPIDLVVVPVAGQTVLVAKAYPQTGVYRSTDGGSTWQLTSFAESAFALLVDGSVVYRYGGDVFRRSFDGGATWQSLPSAQPPLWMAAGGGRLAFVKDGNRLALSLDRGETWTERALPGAYFPPWSEIDSRGNIYIQDGAYRLLRSENEGRTWEPFGQGLPQASLRLKADRYDHLRLFATLEGVPTHGRVYSGRFGATPLELGNGRFSVAVTWRDANGQVGVGSPIYSGGADNGFFWLFSPDRAEIAVKLLDARPIDGHFWIFVASLTNVEFDVAVVDRLDGSFHIFQNPQGAMASFADTTTFPIHGPELAGAAYRPNLAPYLPDTLEIPLGDRFQIEVEWVDFQGAAGSGRGGALNDETVGVYFFDPSNLELLVNVIDGRAINGHYWVFFAGLSNVEYRVRVLDKSTGEEKIYHNPLGTFASVADTAAF